ncbi:hypothetical protein CDCA_CDCA12G3389 [Cyanidium caldarium]|uniref:Cationic amino acid transporter C-terminal domain-containing protein n=1 Tax=Cyanidium caldarium TaxID=2771 RepID=A0AAV9IZ63_CYACA|nr:hypothetical protein CDCA_CDCA12G3389 [Cyanidium caldarium]
MSADGGAGDSGGGFSLGRYVRALYTSSFRRKAITQLNAESIRSHPESSRVLTLLDLVFVGVAGTLGAGIFLLLGRAAREVAGPAVCVSFALAAAVCGLVGLAYAEMSSRVPACGGAYSFAYAALGELCAFTVGWCLSLEYGVASAAIARSWASYLRAGFFGETEQAEPGRGPSVLAALLILVLTLTLCSGMREGRYMIGISTLVFSAVILVVFLGGVLYVRPHNWLPFAPFGLSGVYAGAASVFFAYVGFDEVATVAEESLNPSRNVPLAMIISLVVVTTVYALACVIVTGMVPFTAISMSAPFAAAFRAVGSELLAKLVSLGTVIGLQNTAMVSLVAQPRLFMAMARDGLLPEIFSEVSGSGNAPRAATLLCGCAVAFLALFAPLEALTDLVSGGTLVAFAAVCASLLRTRLIVSGHGRDASILLALLTLSCILSGAVWRLSAPGLASAAAGALVASLPMVLLARVPLTTEAEPPPFVCPYVPWVPALGMLSSVSLMFRLSSAGLLMLLIWISVGLVIYVLYGFRHSLTTYNLPPDVVSNVPPSWRLNSGAAAVDGPASSSTGWTSTASPLPKGMHGWSGAARSAELFNAHDDFLQEMEARDDSDGHDELSASFSDEPEESENASASSLPSDDGLEMRAPRVAAASVPREASDASSCMR